MTVKSASAKDIVERWSDLGGQALQSKEKLETPHVVMLATWAHSRRR